MPSVQASFKPPRTAPDPAPLPRLLTPQAPDLSGFERTMGSVSRGLEKQKQDLDRVETLNITNQIAALRTDMHTRLTSMRGRDAYTAPYALKEEWDKRIGEILKQAPNYDVSVAASVEASSGWAALNESINSHVATESYKIDEQETETGIENARNLAAQSSGNLLEVARQMDRATSIYAEFSERNGRGQLNPDGTPSEAYVNGLNQIQSRMYKSVITKALLDDKTALAQGYFDTAKESGVLNDEDLIYLTQHFSAAKERQKEDLYGQAIAWMDKHRDTGERPEQFPGYGNLSPEQQSALGRHYEAPFYTDKSVWGQFLETPDATLAGMTWAQFDARFRSHFNAQDGAAAEKVWKELRDGKGAGASKDLDDWRSKGEILKKVYTADGKVWEKSGKKKINSASAAYEELVAREERAMAREKGRPVTNEEYEKIAKRVKNQTVQVNRSSFVPGSSEVKLLEMKESDVSNIVVPEVDSQDIASDITANNVQITPDRIRRAYHAMLTGDADAYDAVVSGRQ